MMELIRTVWPIVVALAGLIVSLPAVYWKLRHDQDKNTWRVAALEARMQSLESDVRELKEGSHSQHLDMRVIQTTLEQIKALIGELKDDMRGKVDK